MRNINKLLIEQLDRKLFPFKEADQIKMPAQGWINGIRTTLNMTMAQLGKKLGVTRQAVNRIEASEATGSITLHLLKEVGSALEMKLVYGFVPVCGSVDTLVDQKATELARKIVLRTDHTMMLENQSTDREHIDQAVCELADEIKYEMRRSLWD
ncbi:MAG: mobile mystery protein A [Bacteroidales bacterium]|nr:mobile mystery protein A [Bacteroidales bacterium]